MRPPIRVMFSEVYLGKVLNFSLAFQKPLESQPVMNYRGVLLNLIVILKKRERGGGERKDGEFEIQKKRNGRKREGERDGMRESVRGEEGK